MADFENDCWVTEIARFREDTYWLVTHIDDGEVGRAPSRAEGLRIARAYVPKETPE